MSDSDERAKAAEAVLDALILLDDEEHAVFLLGIALSLVDEAPRSEDLERELERASLLIQARLGLWRGEDELERARAKRRKKTDDE